jgi:riboflavin biosynthesis pyrimidine reductase
MALEPLDVLFEAEGLPESEFPDELTRLYGGDLGLDEPCVYANFVETVDGVVAIPPIPRSNAVVAADSEADRFVMGLLRALADCVLVGAGTLAASPQGTWRPEKVYPSTADAFAELRSQRGAAPVPEVAIVTGRGSIEPAHPVLESGAVVLTSTIGAKRLEGRLPAAATVLALAEDVRLDGRTIVDALHARGHRFVLCEAGPHTFGSLLAADAVQELFVTVSPLLAGDAGPGSRYRLVEAADLVPPRRRKLLSVRRGDEHLLLRYGLTG